MFIKGRPFFLKSIFIIFVEARLLRLNSQNQIKANIPLINDEVKHT
jgi:hypothetical protein